MNFPGFLCGKRGNSSENLALMSNENKYNKKDGSKLRLHDYNVSVYCVADAEEKDKAWKAIEKKRRDKVNLGINENSMQIREIFCSGKDVFFEVNIFTDALNIEAMRQDIKVQIDHNKLEAWIDKSKNIQFSKERDELYPSTHYILVPYAFELEDDTAKDSETGLSFTESQLILLATSLFEFDQLQAAGKIMSYFVKHVPHKNSKLNFGSYWNYFSRESKNYTYDEFNKSANKYCDKKRPPADELIEDEDIFDKICRYYGAQVALYFRFATHISKWAGGLGLIGAFCQMYIFYTLDFESPMLALFAIMVTVWAKLFTEHWKKNELLCTFRWGTDEFESKEEARPECKPPEHNPLKPLIYDYDYYYSYNVLMLKQTFSVLVIVVIMLCVVCSTILIYQFKSFLQVAFVKIGVPSQLSATCASLLNLAQIYIFKNLYQFVATLLNNFENHRTVTEHEDSMISKLTIFTFFNTYISFFYIAFVAGSISVYTDGDNDAISNQCGDTGCMAMLAENLLIVLVMSLTSDKFIEFFIMPLYYKYFNWETIKRIACCQCCTSVDIIPQTVKEHEAIENYCKPSYDFLQRTSDYTILFTYFGYIVLFSAALPVAPLLIAASIAFEVRGDLEKLKKFRRTWAGAQNIGAWQSCFEAITVAGVICNTAVIVFTMHAFSAFAFVIQIWIFIGLQWLMFSLLALGAIIISGPPYKVQIQRRRIEFYKSKLRELHKV